MPNVYFDSSALVKLLVDEQGSDVASQLWDQCDRPLTSRLAYPEVRAALAASARSQIISARTASRAADAFNAYWRAISPIELTSDLARRAGDMSGHHALSGADA